MPESIFQTYLNRLTDLSIKNRSLYLPNLEGYGMLDFRELDFLNGEAAFEILKRAIEGKKKIILAPEFDPRSADANQVSKVLSRIAFRDQLTQEETGEQSLYLAWLFAEGKLINGQPIRSPLLLKPVQLTKENGLWILISPENWQWNPAFLLAWRNATGQQLKESFSDELLENLSQDSLEFRTALARLISDNFAIQVQSNLLEDQILPFPNSRTSLDQERFAEGKVSLKPYAVLGLFAQKGSFIFSDYETLLKNHSGTSLESLFHQLFLSEQKETAVREDKLFPVFPLDASQESALIRVRQGKSLVIQGPPGTGKSQLIANLVSDYIARGKKVLVVSQKRAALDVVYERLANAGFDSFLALVHDFRADQKNLFEKIRKQIESVGDYQSQNRGIDAIQLERELNLLSRTISRLSDKFEEIRTALFDEKPAGIPVKALYLRADFNRPSFSHVGLLQLDFEQARQFERDLKIFHGYKNRFSGSFWEKRISFSKVQPADFAKISKALTGLEKFRMQLPKALKGEKGKPLLQAIWSDSETLARLENLLFSMSRLSDPGKDFAFIFKPKEQKSLAQIRDFLNQAMETSQTWKLDLSRDLNGLSEELKALVPSTQSFFGKLRARFSTSRFPRVFQALSRNQLSFDTQSLLAIQREVGSKIQLQTIFEKLPASSFFRSSGEFSRDLISIEPLFAWKESWENMPEIQGVLDWKSLSYPEFSASLDQIQHWTRELASELYSFRMWLSAEQYVELMEKGLEQSVPENPLTWSSVYSELKGFDQFLEGWKFRGLGLSLFEDFPHSDFDQISAVFWKGWRLAWIGNIERRYPVLSELGSVRLGHEMEELKTCILDKRKNARHLALLRLREQVADHLDYNRLGNQLTYRDLHHQVTKKRQKWSVRKLIEELGEEVFRVLPCWLGSPETVSAVFPVEQLFDLVIFDEASQCPVEKGLPAMLRGRQVVVSGDSNQLRPSDFYQVRWESEEEGLEYEAESLLELGAHFFENMALNGHYRSADPALIHFSNAHFYGNRLQTLPDYATVRAAKTPFSWKKVDGIWENQINFPEAEAVLECLLEIRKNAPGDSVGIVTGNYFQMELIREMLWKNGIQDSGVKVRNIENVQGDEFDQVVLSLGYAPNRAGKLVTNFGLLGKSGAENRLNVAITRARKRVHVISSIEPEDFRAGQLGNPGLVLLREFLAWVKLQSRGRSIPGPEVKAAGFELEWSLKNQLLESDVHYSREIPSAVMDLIWTGKDGEQKAILTDDQRFFDAPTAKAAMAYHPILLEEKGWKWEWQWSRRF